MSEAITMIEAEIGIARRSDWRLVDQAMIDRFAKATDDRQFIHVDPERAALTPFGGKIAHGFLTLSLMSAMFADIIESVPGVRMSINYGLEHLRFVHPVRSGRRIRLAATLVEVAPKAADRVQQAFDVTVEIEGETRPALTARWLFQLLF